MRAWADAVVAALEFAVRAVHYEASLCPEGSAYARELRILGDQLSAQAKRLRQVQRDGRPL